MKPAKLDTQSPLSTFLSRSLPFLDLFLVVTLIDFGDPFAQFDLRLGEQFAPLLRDSIVLATLARDNLLITAKVTRLLKLMQDGVQRPRT